LLNLKNSIQKKFIIAAAIGLIGGLILGLVYGYIIDPVEWVDAPLDLTREDIQEDYLRMAIDLYGYIPDKYLAYKRWQELGTAAKDTMTRIENYPGRLEQAEIYRYKELILLEDSIATREECEALVETNNNLCISLWTGTIILIGLLSVFFYSRTRPQSLKATPQSTPPAKAGVQQRPGGFGTAPFAPEGEVILDHDRQLEQIDPPLSHFCTTYEIGDDLFDESYSIDTPQGEFLGECGIEIVKWLNDDPPLKAAAFDVWLFDKNEINTKSFVLMSELLHTNDIERIQLETKGRTQVAEIGKELTLETDHLIMKIRVVDMVCDQVENGLCEYFQSLTLDINVWQV
jgi:hypothetical protein